MRDEGDAIAIGATTRQYVVENDPLVRAKLPLLAKAMPLVGHAATRARGTVGGSLANGDPAAEIALVAVTLGATLTYREAAQTVRCRRRDFFLGPMVTALPPTACLTRVRFPVWHEPRVGVGFHEVNARQSDFAFVSAAAQIALDDDGRCRAPRSASARRPPCRCGSTRWRDALMGQRIDEAAVREAVTPRSPISSRWPICTPRPNIAAASPSRSRVRAIADAYRCRREARMSVELDINGKSTRSRSSRA